LKPMGLTEAQRSRLHDSDFACPAHRALPLSKVPGKYNKRQVRAAMSRFNQTDFKHGFCHPQKAKQKIIRVARQLGINVDKFKNVPARLTHGRARR